MSTDTRGPKERTFDENIKTHVDAIRRACEAAGINFALFFSLDEIVPNANLVVRHIRAHDATDVFGVVKLHDFAKILKENEDAYDAKFNAVGGGN